MPSSPIRARRGLATLAVALAAVALAACGGGSGGSKVASLSGSAKSASSNKTKSTSAASFRQQMLDYAQCMRDHGVDFPDPQFDANGRPQFDRQGNQSFDQLRNSPNFAGAQKACASKRPNFAGQFQRTPEELAQLRTNLLKYAACMRGKGIDFPDPTFDANGRPQFNRDNAPGGAQGQNRQDPTFQAAAQACRQQVGLRGPGGGPGGGGPFGGRGRGGAGGAGGATNGGATGAASQ